MRAFHGVLFHFPAGFASASFYMAFRNAQKSVWKSYRPVAPLFSFRIVPLVAAALAIPGLAKIIKEAEFSIFTRTYITTVLSAVRSFAYGLGIRFPGIKENYCSVQSCQGLDRRHVIGYIKRMFYFRIEAGKAMAEAAMLAGYHRLAFIIPVSNAPVLVPGIILKNVFI